MKTSLIITSLLFIVALMGCSEDFNLNEPFGHQQSASTKSTGDEGTSQVICEFDELSVHAVSEYMVENKAVFYNPPLQMISNYQVTFDAHTDANRLTNGYIAIIQILMDQECVFESSPNPMVDDNSVNTVSVPFENIRFTELMFKVTLMQTDGPVNRNEDQQVTLRLSKIQVTQEN